MSPRDICLQAQGSGLGGIRQAAKLILNSSRKSPLLEWIQRTFLLKKNGESCRLRNAGKRRCLTESALSDVGGRAAKEQSVLIKLYRDGGSWGNCAAVLLYKPRGERTSPGEGAWKDARGAKSR